MAQTVKVDFEDASGYKSVGVYDTWEESPFRLGTLKGNCAVVDNFISPTNELGEVVNDSKNSGRTAFTLRQQHLWRTHRP